MLQLWREEYIRPVRRGSSLATSIVVHSILITAAVIATKPPAGLVSSLFEWVNRVIYIAPPVRTPNVSASEGRLKFVDGAPEGSGSGFARSSQPGTDRTTEQIVFASTGDLGTDLKPSMESQRVQGMDSVFTVVEVDSAATTDPTSAAPAYPAALLALGVEGYAQVQYVVDSTGLADPSTLTVVKATRVEFAVAVREALPLMHFTPAKMGARRVRQLVEQQFNFRITKVPGDTLKPAKKPPA